MVELGGEVRALGVRVDGTPWKVGIEQPPADDASGAPRKIARVVPLSNRALSTAGDYRNFRSSDGRRYAHLIDPATGKALPYRGASVSVLAETCLEADALDTALAVMGADAALRWCRDHNVAALLQERTAAGGVLTRSTPRFDELAPANE
jgi:thiamine biosynthesis lipoprotein